VARLAGVTPRLLDYWHSTRLIEAHTIPGARGSPRLFSWIDYMKIRAASKLHAQGLSTRRIRAAIAYLDEHIEGWYRYPVHGFGGRVLLEQHARLLTADAQRQLALPIVYSVLDELIDEGPLGELRGYGDVVEMDPEIVSGNPVVRGTRIEAAFLANLVKLGVDPSSVAALYSLPEVTVQRTLAFAAVA
jgi:uncharacterized protein (DUF433 family)/DNA-binding transcriptional MerR regulator